MKENKPKWMWFFGDYELFHSNLLNSRRQEYGRDYPLFTRLANIHAIVGFLREYSLTDSSEFRVTANGIFQVRIDGSVILDDDGVFVCPEGKHTVCVYVCNTSGLPAVFIDGEIIRSEKGWLVGEGSHISNHYRNLHKNVPCGCDPAYYSPNDNVEVFPFEYSRVFPFHSYSVNGGTLYDFGKELFGYLLVEGIKGEFSVYYGESKEEALSEKSAILFEEHLTGDVKLRQRAFRYVFVRSAFKPISVAADYEYLPLSGIGSFSCDDPTIENIFKTCAYTLHLNSRECYIDGIKRDRWVWGGDAYQCFMINPYLDFDTAIIKRTILALLGSLPVEIHVNTINDYSFYTIISVYDYWYLSADTEFVANVYDKVKALYDFCVSRLDDGLVTAREGDWIFIDWSDTLDKDGPHCAEQILLWQATKCIKALAKIVGKSCNGAIDENALKDRIFKLYYNKDKGGFIDGFTSGKNAINRQQNVLALLYDFTDEHQSREIADRILTDDSVPPIRTPYFKFFELLALCKAGRVDIAQNEISSYWGGMLNSGATTFWEEYDPSVSGEKRYSMYGDRFGKSLCHAWGSGPICFLGKYVAGVRPTSAGYATWEVCPNGGIYKRFEASVPLPHAKKVTVKFDGGSVSVFSDADGGTLKFGGKSVEIEKNKLITLKKEI